MTERKTLIDEALRYAASIIHGDIVGPTSYGWNYKSAGAPVRSRLGISHWIKVQTSVGLKPNARLWDGELLSLALPIAVRPKMIAHFDWHDGEKRYRAICSELVEAPVLSKTPELFDNPKLSRQWWTDLSMNLGAINTVKTDRICIRDDLVQRRLREYVGIELNDNIIRRHVVHGDLHWANLTAEPLTILDWESWGLAPFGTDVAFMHIFSLRNSAALELVAETFSSVMAVPDYDIALLFVSAEIVRMFEHYKNYSSLQHDIRNLRQDVIKQGRVDNFVKSWHSMEF